MRSRYRINTPQLAHFVTSTIVEWLPIFTSNAYCDIVVQSFGVMIGGNRPDETKFRGQVRSQTEFGNEGKPRDRIRNGPQGRGYNSLRSADDCFTEPPFASRPRSELANSQITFHLYASPHFIVGFGSRS